MAKKRTLKDFGPEYEALLTRADRALSYGQTEFSIQFDNPEIAHSVRFNTYAYFKALRNSSERPDLIAACQSISMRLASSAVVFYRSTDSATATAIRAALNLPRLDQFTSPTQGNPSGLDANIERLASIRQRSGKS